MIDAFFAGLLLVFQWQTLGFLLLGIFVGVWIGAIPGLGGIAGLALLIPFTFGMETVPAIALLLGMLAVLNTSDTIPAVMIGVPGEASAQATVLDGYPLAQKGHAARAFGAAFAASAIGGVFGAFSLVFCLPLILPIIFAFGSPEYFALGVLGLTMVGSLSGDSILKGLTVACFGLLLSTVGYADAVAVPRYWFGSEYLIDALPFLPVVLGLFALPEIMELVVQRHAISQVPQKEAPDGNMLRGVKDTFANIGLALRCSALGAYIGVLPGLGAIISSWAAYSHAVQSAKDKSQFGRGDIRGVIGPEAANNATLGGSLIPTIAFGIPGSVTMAMMMTAFLIQGLKPGPEMLSKHLDLTFNMVWTVAIANIFVALALMLWSRQVAKVAFVPGHLVVPGVVFFIFMGAWFASASVGDWVSLLLFGVLGFFMKRGGWPRPPLLLGLVIGDIMENALTITTRAYDGWEWAFRPIVLIVFALSALAIVFAVRGIRANRRIAQEERAGGEGTGGSPLIALTIGIFLLCIFAGAILYALDWIPSVRQFPLTAALPGAAFCLAVVAIEARRLYALRARGLDYGAILGGGDGTREAVKAVQFFGYLIGIVLLMLVIGHKLALPLFVFLYLIRWGGYGWRVSLAYAAAAWLVLILFYDRLMHVFWYGSLLADIVRTYLPATFPNWLFI